MPDKASRSRAGSAGSEHDPEETLESTGKAEEQDSEATAQKDLQNYRINVYNLQKDPYLFAVPGSEDADVIVVRRRTSMQNTLRDFDLAIESSSSTIRFTRNEGTPEIESSFRGGNIVESTNTTYDNIQTATRSSSTTPLNVNNRLLKPKAYFESLEKLEGEVQSTSVLGILNATKELESDEPEILNLFRLTSFPWEPKSFMGTSNCSVMTLVEKYKIEQLLIASILAKLDSAHYYELLLRLFLCRNIILGATQKIQAMETASYCGIKISILLLDTTRENVARLVAIDCHKIRALAEAFEYCFKYVLQGPKDGWESRLASKSGEVTLSCQSILSQLGLAASVDDMSNTWFSTVLVLETAILSYVGAHLEHLDGIVDDLVVLPRMGTQPSQHFPMPSNQSHNSVFQDVQSQWTGVQATCFQGVNSNWGSAPTRIVFEKRTFSCLNKFLRHKTAWVCRNCPVDVEELGVSVDDQPALFLSTDAESFADVWGPMWSSHAKDHPDQVIHYNVGNGMILPWKEYAKSRASQVQTRQSGRLGDIKEERLCHWISDKDAQEESNLLGATGMYLSPSDQLLIGASRASEKLEVNHSCKTSPSRVKEFLRDFGVLHRAGTIKKNRYRDSETVQTQVGWSGMTMGIQANYKIRERTWKEVIIETWKNDHKRRVPRILEFWLGVEVSMCTQNARRRRLISLLGSDTMQTYLKSLSLGWTEPDREIEFYAALSNPDHTAFRTLWDSHVDWRSDLGAAIECCLDALATTGEVDGDLQALWVPEAASECMVTLPHQKHSWTRFLKDTRDSCTLAVFNVACLQHSGIPKEKYPSSCQSSRLTSQSHLELLPLHSKSSLDDVYAPEGKTLLQTSIILNNEHLPRGINLNTYHRRDGSAGTYEQRWNVNTLEIKQDFRFGEKGILEVIDTLSCTQVLTSWKSVSVQWMLKGKASSKHHHEFMGDEELDTRPLDVVLQSKSKVENYRLLSQKPSRGGADGPSGGL